MFTVEYRKIIRLLFIWLAAVALLGAGCEPEEEILGSASSSTQAVGDADQTKPSGVDLVCEKILKGDFETAEKLIASLDASTNPQIAQLGRIVDEYKSIQARSDSSKKEALAEQKNELDELRKKFEPDFVVDANDISEIISVVIRAREYVDEDKKADFLEDAFIQKVLASAIEKGKELDAEGRWVDAYARVFYWLVNLDTEDKQYKDYAEELSEKALIEISLKDDSCGQSSIARHEGIKADMVFRALRALETNYVNVVDYNEMAEKGLARCRHLGEVLTQTKKKLDYTVSADKAEKWLVGVRVIEKELAASSSAITSEKFRMIFGEILALNSIALEIPEEVVISQFAEASFSGLDPYTTLVWPWQVKDFQKNMTQQFIGIGVEISKATGALKVVSLLPDTPAYTSGLDADDEILAVDGESTEDMTILCAVSKITGPRHTKVTLTIRHAGSDKTVDIPIVRDRIVVPPLRGWQRAGNGQWDYTIDPDNGVGYVRITGFTETTGPDMDKILSELEDQGLKGLILDLRFNSGGYLISAAAVVDMFVEKGMIVKSQPRTGFPTRENAKQEGTHPNYPLVVLINGQSASASEIVAGALQDEKFKRATLVGTRSYGKGSVQVVTPYTGGDSQLKYTMAYYHLPSGQQVKNRDKMEKEGRKDWGIKPDIEVELKMNELREMVDVQRANEVLAKADHDADKPLKRHSWHETLQADKQLAVALLAVKSKMIQAGHSVKFVERRDVPATEKVATSQ